MLREINSFINSNQLFNKEDKLLVATSGGVDSVVLCHLLSQLNYNITIAHCNFQLRGNESNKDETYCKQLASSLNTPIYHKTFDTKAYSKNNKVSIQIAARNLRYEWFKELINKHEFTHVLTAHHASDQAETIIYNLAKGCGISGVRGIPLKNEHIVRPLLFASKDNIIEYAKEHKLEWREDASNQENKYSRNLIRNQIIPQLKKINTGLEDTMLRNADRFKSIELFINSEVHKAQNQYLSQSRNGWVLDLSWLSIDNETILQHILFDFGFNYFQTKDILQSINISGKTFYNDQYQLLIDRNQLLISFIQNNKPIDVSVNKVDKEVYFEINKFKLSILNKTDIEITKDRHIAYIDYEKIDFPFKIRYWHKGDSFLPLGMKSKKKLSDFMIDEKIPVNLKKQLPIFVSKEEIFWIAGYRIDNRYKITDNTKQVLVIEMSSQNV